MVHSAIRLGFGSVPRSTFEAVHLDACASGRCQAPEPSISPGYDAIPISYTIDAENGLVLSVGRGVVTNHELFDYLRAQTRSAGIPLPLRDLHDLRQVERFDPGSEDLRSIVAGLDRDPQRLRDARVAIIAPKDHVYGMYRMFELLSQHTPPVEELRRQGHAPEVKVFRDAAEARAWLSSAKAESS